MDQSAGTQTDVVAPDQASRDAQRAFSMAMVLSGIRCIVAYILLPFAIPFLGLAPGVGPWLGVALGGIAIGANVFSIRRFARSSHRLRKLVIAINVTVIVILTVLLAFDLRSALSA